MDLTQWCFPVYEHIGSQNFLCNGGSCSFISTKQVNRSSSPSLVLSSSGGTWFSGCGGRDFWVLSLDPIGVHVLYAPVPVYFLFHHSCSLLQHPEITGEGRGKV